MNIRLEFAINEQAFEYRFSVFLEIVLLHSWKTSLEAH